MYSYVQKMLIKLIFLGGKMDRDFSRSKENGKFPFKENGISFTEQNCALLLRTLYFASDRQTHQSIVVPVKM